MSKKIHFKHSREPITKFDAEIPISLSDNAAVSPSGPNQIVPLVEELPASIPSQSHLLMISLLEHLCNLYVKDSNKSQQLFKALTKNLSHLQLISPLNRIDELSGLRAQCRASFLKLIQASLSSQDLSPKLTKDPSPENYQNWIASRSTVDFSQFSSVDNFQFYTSRYLEEFTQLGYLGKGGYGSVYKARNKLDGNIYAVKMIAFSSVQSHIWVQMLREVKCLSSLQHKNIVRYYGAWLEHATIYHGAMKSFKDLPMSTENSRVTSFPRPHNNIFSTSLSLVETSFNYDLCQSNKRFTSKSNGDSIVFVNSDEEPSSRIESESMLVPATNRSHNSHSFNKVHSPESLHAILHIQMEACSKTMKEWLVQRNVSHRNDIDKNRLTCENLKILKSILKAVSYFHKRDIIHRDLKPQNIFIIDSEDVENGLVIKIGDFGLSRTIFDSPLTPNPGYEASTDDFLRNDHYTGGVGTTIYASPEQLRSSNYGLKSDMFSIGLIWFELYYPFSTEMERIECLKKLRKGIFPEEFQALYPHETECISDLLSLNPDNRPSAEGLLNSSFFLDKNQLLRKVQKAYKLKCHRVELLEKQVDRLKLENKMLKDELSIFKNQNINDIT